MGAAKIYKKIIPIMVLFMGATLFFIFDLQHYFSFSYLKSQHQFITNMVQQYYILAVFAYIGLYIAVTAFSLPIATILTLSGGFMFGAYLGTFYTVIAATIGATIVFIVAKNAFYDFFHQKCEGMIEKLQDGFKENGFYYLLTLRLVPLFPFVVVNIAPAFLNISARTFIIATFIGIIPGTFVYNLAGAGLTSIFAHGDDFSLENIATPTVVIALLALGALSLVPVIYKYFKAKA